MLGVSPDPVKRVKKFHEGQGLNFTLLADEDHAVCDAYGVWGEKSMYGKTYWGAMRSTFIVGADGNVVHVIEKASPKTHAADVLALLEQLDATGVAAQPAHRGGRTRRPRTAVSAPRSAITSSSSRRAPSTRRGPSRSASSAAIAARWRRPPRSPPRRAR